jgi:hypothetical protein
MGFFMTIVQADQIINETIWWPPVIQSLKSVPVELNDDIRSDFKKYFEGSDHGGALHLILEDQKWDTRTVDRCLREANFDEDFVAVELCKLLQRMTISQRREVLEPYL